MNLFFFTVFCLYFLLLLILDIGWREAFEKKKDAPEAPRFSRITVIAPFRNEVENIGLLIKDLTQLTYPEDRVDFILVDDHSTDGSMANASTAIGARPRFQLLSLPPGMAGKKSAIQLGIGHAKGEIVVTTDADCRVPAGWLEPVDLVFTGPKVKLAFGGLRMEPAGFFGAMQSLEFCSLIGSGAATAALGFPTLCNGANLAFLKSAFLEVNGFEGNLHVPSGDDEFLMRKIADRFPDSIHFIPYRQNVVATRPQPNGRAFLAQRIRWASKWRFNTSAVARLLAVGILVVQASFLAVCLAPFVNTIDWRLALALVVAKACVESVFLYQVARFLNVKWRLLHFAALQFTYPVYVIYVGIASFFGTYEWKGRKYDGGAD